MQRTVWYAVSAVPYMHKKVRLEALPRRSISASDPMLYLRFSTLPHSCSRSLSPSDLLVLGMSRVNSYIIDTNIINYILDGKLWARQPASLMRARPELLVAYRQAGENFETTNKFYPSLCLSKLAHQWCVTQHPQLFVPPTVHTDDASTSSECISSSGVATPGPRLW